MVISLITIVVMAILFCHKYIKPLN